MNERADALKARVERQIINFCVTLHQGLVLATPIATGQARANWQMQLNGRDTSFLPGNKSLHRPAHVDYEGYASAAEAEVQFFVSGDVVYIYNNAPYIGALNAGRSPQAQAGFIESVIAGARSALGDL